MVSPLVCTGCTQKFPFPGGYFFYTDLPPGERPQAAGIVCPETASDAGLHFWPLLIHLIWCLQCDRPSFIERIPVMRELNAIAALRRSGKKPHQHDIEDDLLWMDDDQFAAYYRHMLNRSPKPKCLLCAGSYFVLINQAERETGLRHEACWGSPIVYTGLQIGAGIPVRYHDYHVRHYNPDGLFVWAEACFACIDRYRLVVVLAPGADSPDRQALIAVIDAILANDPDMALILLAPLLSRQLPAALGLLGALHYAGRGVAHDGQQAIALLRRAVAAGDGAALHNLACLFCTGAPGVPRDDQQGRALFGQAWRQGAQYADDAFYAAGVEENWEAACFREIPA